jgi:hypothetical protein
MVIRPVVARLILVLQQLILAGCMECPDPTSDPIDASEVPGRYTANFGDAQVEYIDLRADSTYVFYRKSSDSELYVDSGTWVFVDRARCGCAVVLCGDFVRIPRPATDQQAGQPLDWIDSVPPPSPVPLFRSGDRQRL